MEKKTTIKKSTATTAKSGSPLHGEACKTQKPSASATSKRSSATKTPTSSAKSKTTASSRTKSGKDY